MPAKCLRSKPGFCLLCAGALAALLATPVVAQYLRDGDDADDGPVSGFGQTDPGDGPNELHYHYHTHYHTPYLSHSDDTRMNRPPGGSTAAAQPLAPNGVAGANRYYTPGYTSRSRTPSPPTRFLGDREDAGPTEIMDSPGADDASDNDEVGENTDQPSARMASDNAGEIVDRPSYAFGPRALPGDRGYLRVIVPSPDTKLIYDGHEVSGKGLLRSVMTARVAPGQSLPYTLVAYWKDSAGHPRVSVHEAAIGAGDHQTVQFNVAVSD
jgi:hypothetical protein